LCGEHNTDYTVPKMERESEWEREGMDGKREGK
jgi:hypothetical protein